MDNVKKVKCLVCRKETKSKMFLYCESCWKKELIKKEAKKHVKLG